MNSLNKFLDNLTTFRVVHSILALGLITFANALFNPFVWDDHAYILLNPLTQSFNFFNYFGDNIFNNSGQYRPLTLTYFALLHTLFGNIQFFYHVTQILLHIINTSLLFVLFKFFFNKKLAFFLGLIFLVHPMQVESVSYISASGGALSFFFGIIALLLAGRKNPTKLSLSLQYLLLLASMLVKETGLLFIPLLLLYQWIRNKDIKFSIIYSFAAIAVYLFFRIGIGNIFLADRPLIPIARLTFFERILTIPEVVWYYIKTFFFPVPLAIDQQWIITKITFQSFYLPLILDFLFLSGIILFGFHIYKKQKDKIKVYLFFSVWFILGLLLYSQIVPLDMTVADRWFYFHIAGLLGIIGILLQRLFFDKNHWKTILTISGIVIIALLITRTVVRNNDWSDHTKLYTHDISVSDNFLINAEFAIDLVRAGKFEEALAPAKKSVEYFPHEENLYNLGYIYEQLGDLPKAKDAYTRALQATNYTPGETHHNLVIYIRLANILIYSEDTNNAKSFIENALTYYPDSDRLWLLLGISEYKLGNTNAALKAVEKAVNLSPNNEFNQNVYLRLVNNQPLDITLR
jgi:tetratricopeptide (TPR) repeat protein